jgi:hypothetical protein
VRTLARESPCPEESPCFTVEALPTSTKQSLAHYYQAKKKRVTAPEALRKPALQPLVKSRRKLEMNVARVAARLRYHGLELLQLIGKRDLYMEQILGKEPA